MTYGEPFQTHTLHATRVRLRGVAEFAMAAFAVLACSVSFAAQFPAKPIRLVTSYPPGGGTDAVARPIAASFDSINTELHRALTDRSIAEPLLVQGAEASPSTPEAVTRVMRDEHARWMKVIQSQNLKF